MPPKADIFSVEPDVCFVPEADLRPNSFKCRSYWFKPEGDKLTLMDVRVQKGPKQDGDSYYMITRMPVAWWWLPVQEHPGDMEVRRAWHVMSAIHNYIANNKDAQGNLVVKDDKTGESIPLEFIEMHQPIRHMKKDGQYFACTDFRKPGSKDEGTVTLIGNWQAK